MRKAFELAEKEAKNREKLAEEKRQKLLNDLDAARTVQFKNKEDRLAQEAREERDNYLHVIQCQKDDEEKERRIEDQRKNAFKNHQQSLLMQVDENVDKKKIVKLDYLEEGRKLRQKLADEILKIETIKTNKISQMENLNISK